MSPRVCKLCGMSLFAKGRGCKCQGSAFKLLFARSVAAEHRYWSVGERCRYHIEKYLKAKTSQERSDHKKAIDKLIKIKYID